MLSADAVGALAASFPGARAGEATLLGSGWNADAWRVPDPGGDLVVRVPTCEWARGEIERQACLAPKLAAHGVPVPPEWVLLRDAAGNVVAGVYRYVAGDPAPARGHVRRRVIKPVTGLVERIHSFPLDEALGCGAESLDPWEGRWRPIIEAHAPGLPPKTRAWVESAGERLRKALQYAGELVLVHGDLQPAHILLHPDLSVAAVLDFSGPIVSDRAIDFGRLVQFWDRHFAARVRVAYSLPKGRGYEEVVAFWERMNLYALLEPLRTIAVEAEMGENLWTPWARRKLTANSRVRL
jgi:aminoglycoside phosphotransferase (APT) family kinase protein